MTPVDFSKYIGREKEIAEIFDVLGGRGTSLYIQMCITLQNYPKGLKMTDLTYEIYKSKGLQDPREFNSLIGHVSKALKRLEKVGIVKGESYKTKTKPGKQFKLNPEMTI